MPIRFQSVHQRMQASLPSLPNESQTVSRLKHQQRKTVRLVADPLTEGKKNREQSKSFLTGRSKKQGAFKKLTIIYYLLTFNY